LGWTNGAKQLTCPVQSNHRLKLWLFKYYAIISAAAFVATLLFFFSLWVHWHTFSWQSLAAVIGGIISFTFAVQKQQLEEVHLFTKLFKEFNERYDHQNDVLNCINCQPAERPLSSDETKSLFNYFNLCGEEYLYFKRGFIYPEVWQAWKNGMIFYRQNPRIKKLWDDDLKSGSYYGLNFD
jgi:hypothetical protein